MNIRIKRLPSGYYHIQGEGVCNWAQVERFPCTKNELRDGAFAEAGEDFIQSVLKISGMQCVSSLYYNPIKN